MPDAEQLAIEPNQVPISDLTDNTEGAVGEFRRRNSPYDYVSVHRADTAELIEKGWEVARRGKRTNRLRRLKSHYAALEDRFWCLLYKNGISRSRKDRVFNRVYKRQRNSWQ